jgi:hypothetical protein
MGRPRAGGGVRVASLQDALGVLSHVTGGQRFRLRFATARQGSPDPRLGSGVPSGRGERALHPRLSNTGAGIGCWG